MERKDREQFISEIIGKYEFNTEDLKVINFSDRGHNTFIFDDDERRVHVAPYEYAMKRVTEYITERVWVFDTAFLSDYAVDMEALENIQTRYENACEMIIDLISAGEGMDSLVSDAIAENGLGNLLQASDARCKKYAIDGQVYVSWLSSE